jgi:hypothetical protein
MQSIYFLVFYFVLLTSLLSHTFVLIDVNSDKYSSIQKEIEITFANAGWNLKEVRFCLDTTHCAELEKASTQDSIAEIQESEDSFTIRFLSNPQIQSFYSRTPKELRKQSMENFESFLSKEWLRNKLNTTKSPIESNFSAKLFSNQKSYRLGESIELGFETFQDGYIYVVLVPENGTSPILLFPNSKQPSNKIPANQKVMISSDHDKIIASQPLGRDKILIYSSPKEWTHLEWKEIPGSRFHTIYPNSDRSKKNILGGKDREDWGEIIKASSELSWEIIPK